MPVSDRLQKLIVPSEKLYHSCPAETLSFKNTHDLQDIDEHIGQQRAMDALGANFDLVVPYLIMIVVLMVRPYGIYGTKEVIRV